MNPQEQVTPADRFFSARIFLVASSLFFVAAICIHHGFNPASMVRDAAIYPVALLVPAALWKKTAPYMHDGNLKTLKEVVDLYIGGSNSNPHLDKEIHSLSFLTGPERAGLVAFLQSLTGEMPPNVGPPANQPAKAPK